MLSEESSVGSSMEQQRRGNVDRWELVETVHSKAKEVGNASVKVALEITRPIFVDGNSGYPRLNLTLSRNDKSFRFQCQEGDTGEILALADFLLEITGISKLDKARMLLRDIESEGIVGGKVTTVAEMLDVISGSGILKKAQDRLRALEEAERERRRSSSPRPQRSNDSRGNDSRGGSDWPRTAWAPTFADSVADPDRKGDRRRRTPRRKNADREDDRY